MNKIRQQSVNANPITNNPRKVMLLSHSYTKPHSIPLGSFDRNVLMARR